LQFFHFFKKSKHNILRVTERFLPFPKKFSHLIILKHLLRSPIFFKPQRRGWGRAIKEKTFYTKEKPLSFIVTNKKKPINVKLVFFKYFYQNLKKRKFQQALQFTKKNKIKKKNVFFF